MEGTFKGLPAKYRDTYSKIRTLFSLTSNVSGDGASTTSQDDLFQCFTKRILNGTRHIAESQSQALEEPWDMVTERRILESWLIVEDHLLQILELSIPINRSSSKSGRRPLCYSEAP